MLASLAYPLAQSFERRIRLYKKWKHMFPAMLITAGFFIIWDEFFTRIGVWSFNPQYVTGIYIGSLPLEEWLFFLVVPYACFFVYFVAEYFIKKDPFRTTNKVVSVIFTLALLVFAGLNYNRWYTATTCILPAILLIWLTFVKQVNYLGRFFTGYFISLIPFLIVNGILTSKPVVEYNNLENSGLRIVIPGLSNIPVEDLAYCLLLLLLNVSLYERFSQRYKV
ncbi:MAG: lycopene cyclase domain-containing protein [Bacteroidetes bacterium]|nr:lycopene cyclase domain-containing protein [Bacteroidota bacterium]